MFLAIPSSFLDIPSYILRIVPVSDSKYSIIIRIAKVVIKILQ